MQYSQTVSVSAGDCCPQGSAASQVMITDAISMSPRPLDHTCAAVQLQTLNISLAPS
jgi:hypothetical protein